MGMEDETRAFFILIANSIALVLLWMLLNILFGIYWGYAFFDDHISWKNILYYILSLTAFVLVILRLIRQWKNYK